ncbi:MAG: ArsR/SmtB family transcription factor [Vicinamibacteria bacterium]
MTPADIDRTLSALADPTRRGVVDLLRRRPRPAGEIAAALEVTAPALSRHLRVLRRRGLIEEERDENDFRLRIYRLRPEPFAELQSWLRQVEAFWSEQLDSFQQQVERKKKGRRE